MRKSRFTEEQIIGILNEQKRGLTTAPGGVICALGDARALAKVRYNKRRRGRGCLKMPRRRLNRAYHRSLAPAVGSG
jgi:hypothetical protein